MSQYVYAFTNAPIEVEIPGLSGAETRWIEHAGIAVAISEAPGGKLRPQRRHLAAHQAVVSDIASRVDALPASFGLVAESEEALRILLDNESDAIAEQLGRVGGCLEMSLSLSWDVENVFEHLVSIDDELSAMRDEIASYGNDAPHNLKVSVGRRVEAILNGERAHASALLDEAVGAICREIVAKDPGSDQDLAAITALVAREDLGLFETAVEEMAADLGDEFVIGLSGPFAPHNFVDLRLAFEPQDA